MTRLTTLLAEWADLNLGAQQADAGMLADALRRACVGLPDSILRACRLAIASTSPNDRRAFLRVDTVRRSESAGPPNG